MEHQVTLGTTSNLSMVYGLTVLGFAQQIGSELRHASQVKYTEALG